MSFEERFRPWNGSAFGGPHTRRFHREKDQPKMQDRVVIITGGGKGARWAGKVPGTVSSLAKKF